MPTVVLDCPTTPNDTGAFRLAWDGPAGAQYRLRESAGDAWRVIYEGPDVASTVTGRAAGTYAYRLETPSVPGGDVATCVVEVAPPPLSLACGLFAVGFALCLATVLLVWRGHRRHRRGELG